MEFRNVVHIPYSTDFCRHRNREIFGHGFQGKVGDGNREIFGKLGTVFEAKCGTEIEKFMEKIILIFSAENVNLIFSVQR